MYCYLLCMSFIEQINEFVGEVDNKYRRLQFKFFKEMNSDWSYHLSENCQSDFLDNHRVLLFLL